MAPKRPQTIFQTGLGTSGVSSSIGSPELEQLKFLRRLLSVRGVRTTYTIKQTVKDNASSGVFLPNDPNRETIIISYTGTNAQRVSLSPDVASNAGITLNANNTPLFFTREAFGELVTAEWYYSGFDGLQLSQCITVIERIRI